MKKNRIVLIIISVIGITYAIYAWDFDTKFKGDANCFDVIYTKGRDIGNSENGSTLTVGSNFNYGLSTTVVVKLNSNCSVEKGKGTLYLNTSTETGSSLISSWALKYQVIDGNNFVSSGTVSSIGKLAIYNDFDITYLDKSLIVVVWLDGSLITNDNQEEIMSSKYKGHISLDVENRGQYE